MAALLSRQQTGKGVWIDCNLFETQVEEGVITVFSYTLIMGWPFTLDCRIGQYWIELSNCGAGGVSSWHSTPFSSALSGVSMQGRLYHDWRGQ